MEDHKECNTLSRNVHIVQCHARLSEISYDTGLPPELNHIVVNYVVGHGMYSVCSIVLKFLILMLWRRDRCAMASKRHISDAVFQRR